MSKDHNWQFDLEEYVRQGEPEQTEKSAAWKTAIGLQDVDGLKTSAYLLEKRKGRGKIEADTMEADIVSARISGLLSETQKELAVIIGKSERTVKTRTVELQQKGFLRRENGRRNERWEVLIPLSDE